MDRIYYFKILRILVVRGYGHRARIVVRWTERKNTSDVTDVRNEPRNP